MKRDMQLIYEILRRLEDHSHDPSTHNQVSSTFENYDKTSVSYHIDLLCEAGLIKAARNTLPLKLDNLTWDGHELLDKLRTQFEKSSHSGVH